MSFIDNSGRNKMGKKYLDTKKGSLEQSILGVWQMAVEESNARVDGRTKQYKEHRAKLEAARLRREKKNLNKEGSKEEYQKFFNAAMKKFGVDSPADFKSDAEKKKFFNYVDKNYKGDHEEEVQKLHKELFGLEEGPFSSKSSKIQTKVAPAVKTFKGKGKKSKSKKEEVEEGKMSDIDQMMKDGKSAEEIAKALKMDVKSVKKVMGESYEIGTDEYRKHTEDITPGEDGEWVDAINKKNDSMREALAKVWGVSEGKSPFEKKSLTKEVKDGKTMTGKKIASVDINPTIKEKKK